MASGYGMAEALAASNAACLQSGAGTQPANAEAADTAERPWHGQSHALGRRRLGRKAPSSHAMNETHEAFGRIDSVIANAGVGFGSPSFVDMDTETWRKNMAVNLDGAFWTMREACRFMVARAKAGDPGGSVAGVASLAAIEGAARNQAYAATKGGLISMLKATAVEYARYGIRANAILPGWIATDMTAGAQGNDKFEKNVITRVPARRWGEPKDFGGIAVYLTSDASSYHSGDTFLIDGAYAIF